MVLKQKWRYDTNSLGSQGIGQWAAHALVASTGIAWYWRNMMVIWYQFSREGIGQLRLRLWQFLLLVQWKLVTAVQESATPPLPAAITFQKLRKNSFISKS